MKTLMPLPSKCPFSVMVCRLVMILLFSLAIWNRVWIEFNSDLRRGKTSRVTDRITHERIMLLPSVPSFTWTELTGATWLFHVGTRCLTTFQIHNRISPDSISLWGGISSISNLASLRWILLVWVSGCFKRLYLVTCIVLLVSSYSFEGKFLKFMRGSDQRTCSSRRPIYLLSCHTLKKSWWYEWMLLLFDALQRYTAHIKNVYQAMKKISLSSLTTTNISYWINLRAAFTLSLYTALAQRNIVMLLSAGFGNQCDNIRERNRVGICY